MNAKPGWRMPRAMMSAVPLGSPEKGRATNFGVFLVAGRPSGLYARLQAGATDGSALSAPVLVRP